MDYIVHPPFTTMGENLQIYLHGLQIFTRPFLDFLSIIYSLVNVMYPKILLKHSNYYFEIFERNTTDKKSYIIT